MTSLTSTPHGVARPNRHGRSRALASHHAARRRAISPLSVKESPSRVDQSHISSTVAGTMIRGRARWHVAPVFHAKTACHIPHRRRALTRHISIARQHGAPARHDNMTRRHGTPVPRIKRHDSVESRRIHASSRFLISHAIGCIAVQPGTTRVQPDTSRFNWTQPAFNRMHLAVVCRQHDEVPLRQQPDPWKTAISVSLQTPHLVRCTRSCHNQDTATRCCEMPQSVVHRSYSWHL